MQEMAAKPAAGAATTAAAPAAGPAPHSFTKEQIAEYRSVFDEADEDKSGSIETAELKAVIEKCGLEVTDAQVREMIKEADTDNSGTLDFAEYLALMWRLQSGPSEREVRNEIFVVSSALRSLFSSLTWADIPATAVASFCSPAVPVYP